MKKTAQSLTDWDRVRKAYESDEPIPYDPEDGPYDPNDDAAVEAYWAQATITRPNHRGPQKAPVKKQVSLRLSPEVLAHFKSSGRGWQTRIDETLKKAIEPKRRRKAS
ncbi:MAG: BrnA antitoxin family protein [Acidobacteriaceae bacterium]